MKNIYNLLKLAFYEPDYILSLIKHNIMNFFNFKGCRLKKISLLLTYRCNLSCVMCALGENKNASENNLLFQEMTLEDVKDIIDFARVSHSGIWLTGGEPLLNDKWILIAEYIKKNKLRCYLQTNGVLLEKYKKDILAYIDFLNVSLDGAPSVHDSVRGKKDAFEKVLSGLRTIDDIKKKTGRRKPYINICYTITGDSYKSLDKLIEILQDENIDINSFNFQHLEFLSYGVLEKYKQRFEKEGKDVCALNIFSQDNIKIDTDSLVEKIKELKKRKLKFNLDFFPDLSPEDIEKYYKFPEYFSKKVFRNCRVPYEEIFVHPQGDIWICPSKVIGNFKKEGFSQILKKIEDEARTNSEVCRDCLGELYMYHMVILYLKGLGK